MNNEIIKLKNTVCYVQTGYVALCANLKDVEIILLAYKEGDIIDDVSNNKYVDYLPGFRMTLRAYGAVTLLCQSKQTFQDQVFATPKSGTKYVKYLQDQNNLVISRLIALSYKDVYRRLVARILFIAQRFGNGDSQNVIVSLPITHTELALSVSSTRETVNKLIKKLSQKGIITMKSKTIVVHSMQQLEKELA